MQGLSPLVVNLIKHIPSQNSSHTGLNSPKTSLPYTATSKLENANCMRMSVLQSNIGGSRGVKPCVGTPFSHIVLRKPPLPSHGGIQVHQGFARDQPRGMGWDKDKPMNLPILKTHDMYNPAMNSKFR